MIKATMSCGCVVESRDGTQYPVCLHHPGSRVKSVLCPAPTFRGTVDGPLVSERTPDRFQQRIAKELRLHDAKR